MHNPAASRSFALNWIHLDSCKQTDIIFMDMQKAFDKVGHITLINKLQQYNIGGSLLQWFTLYLHDRQQRITTLCVTSSQKPVCSGVQQGSILAQYSSSCISTTYQILWPTRQLHVLQIIPKSGFRRMLQNETNNLLAVSYLTKKNANVLVSPDVEMAYCVLSLLISDINYS